MSAVESVITSFSALAEESLVHSPIYFSAHYIFIAIGFIILAVAVVALTFYLTRKKPIKTISSLKPSAPKTIDIAGIRNRYLAALKEVEIDFDTKKIKASVAHQRISMLVRLFYAEASGFHAEYLTLNDLKRTSKKSLTEAIGEYYPSEFDQLEKGPVSESVRKAESLIMSDEAIRRRG